MAITCQFLAGPRLAPGAETILEVVRRLAYLQLDPISAVERSHILVLWSRFGTYDPVLLDRLLWEERQLFEYWAHAAAIVPTADYPLHAWRMRQIGSGVNAWIEKQREWLEANEPLRQGILERLRRMGPLPPREMQDLVGTAETPWPAERSLGLMLDHLWLSGAIMVARRKGRGRLWDIAARCLPADVPRDDLAQEQVVRQAAERSLRALGVARPTHIQTYFLRDSALKPEKVLDDMEAEGVLRRVAIVEGDEEWPGPWYVHRDDLPLLERLAAGEWEPRTTLLSPFDNLIIDRARTRELFGFDYAIEIYKPAAKREYGYYVMPILHGDRLVGRIDPKMERNKNHLVIQAVYTEPGAPEEAGPAIAAAIEDLAVFLGAQDVIYAQ